MVKLTGAQRIDLGVKEDLPHVWRDLGMPSGHAYGKTFRTCKTCVGTEFCRYGVGDSTTLSHVRKGDILCVVDTHDEVLVLTGRFMQYYRENARYLERTYAFVEGSAWTGQGGGRRGRRGHRCGPGRGDAGIRRCIRRSLAGGPGARDPQPVRCRRRKPAVTASTLSEHSVGPLAQIPPGEGRVFECQGRLVAVSTSGAVACTPRRPRAPTGAGRSPTAFWPDSRSG